MMTDKPLTKKDLLNMIGQPVWCEDIESYGIVGFDEEMIDGKKYSLWLRGYYLHGHGVGFELNIAKRKLKLYRQKPEQRKDDVK